MRKTVLLFFALFLFVSCARREDYIAAHPSLSKEYAQAIREGKIKVGMTKEEVHAAWGPHCWYCHGTRENSWGDVWEYNIFGSGTYGAGKGTYVFFNNAGKVTSISR